MKFEDLIGGYQTFFSDLLFRMKQSGIDIVGKALKPFNLLD